MALTAQQSQTSAFAILGNRSFTLLWTGDLVSTIGSALNSLAASILIYRLTNSALSVGLMLIVSAIPSIFVGLIAGVFVDRLERKRIMVASDIVRALLVALIPLLIRFNIAWLYIIVLLCSMVEQFYQPAHESVLPEVATDQELAAANSLMAISGFGSTAVGFAAAGFIASAASIDWAFYIDSLTFIFSASCILFLRFAPLSVNDKTNVTAVVNNLKSGIQFLFKNPILRSLFFIYLPVFLSFGLWNSLLLPFAKRALNATEFQYGLQEALTSLGFVIASLLLARFADRWREGQWMVISFTGMGIVGLFFAMSDNIPVAIMLVMLSGFLNAPSSLARRLVIQRNTLREVRGRVLSAFFVSRDVVLLLGMAAAGLADLINVRVLVMAASILLIGAGTLALLMPGLGQPAREWRRALALLRGAKVAPGLSMGRAATLADMDLLISRLPVLSGLSVKDKQILASQTLIADAPAGTAIIKRGETNDAAYFILQGRAVAGREEGDAYRTLEELNAGDFFGEIAALTGVPRTADVVTEEPTTILQVPSITLRTMMNNPQINQIFLNKMTERMVRMNMIDFPRYVGLDQQTLRELRTIEPEVGPA
jgi:DHA3 family macrolide efflux protein-like MFS transporter